MTVRAFESPMVFRTKARSLELVFT